MDDYLNNEWKLALKVLTFNIHNGINWYGSYDLNQIVAFIREINPDLVGIQEVSRFWSSKTNYQDLVKEMANNLRMNHSFSATLQKKKASFGNLILSRYPIVNTWAKVFFGKHEPRNCLAVQVQAEGVRINFLTTHLGLSNKERLEQARGIIKFGADLGNPIIVTGDFNEGPDEPGVSLLRSSWRKAIHCPVKGTFRLTDQTIGPEIDMVLFSSDFTLKQMDIPENYLSDHLPVIVDLEYKVSWLQTGGQPVGQTIFH